MDRKVSFFEQVITRSSTGAEKVVWKEKTPKSWAKVEWVDAGEKDEGKQTVGATLAKLTIRYRTDLLHKQVLLLEGKYYDIIDVHEGKWRRQYTVITAKAKDNDWIIPIQTP